MSAVSDNYGGPEDMNSDTAVPYLLTNHTFNRRDYILKMYVKNDTLKLSLIDCITSEKWQCSFNSIYIEELTKRTGNYKKFTIFITMLNSAILKTNGAVRLELLNQNDLEKINERRKYRPAANDNNYMSSKYSDDNRKYLILVYIVEFDKIHYPLPLEYCGMPNPRILQKRINYLEREKLRLEVELSQNICTKCSIEMPKLQKKVDDLIEEKTCLEDDLKYLVNELDCRKVIKRKNDDEIGNFKSVEEKAIFEKAIDNLRSENMKLIDTIEKLNKELSWDGGDQKFEMAKKKTCKKCELQIRNNSNNKMARNVDTKTVKVNRKMVESRTLSRERKLSGSGGGNISSASTGAESENKKLKRRTVSNKLFPRTRKLRSGSECGRGSSSSGCEVRAADRVVGEKSFGKRMARQRREPISMRSLPNLNRSRITTQSNGHHSNEVEQLKCQINELVHMIERWSQNFHNNSSHKK